MSTSIRAAMLMVALSLLATAARSDGISKAFNDTLFGGVSVPSTGGALAPNGKVLLADGVSFLLQTDGTSKVCLAGGC